MKLTGIVTVGTYNSPWFSYGLASFYFCDEIVVTNGGYDLKKREGKYNIPLKQVSKDISDLDVDGKVFEWKGWTIKDLKTKLVLATEKDHPPTSYWADMRGIGLTLAVEKAFERGADWILKWDSDQVGYSNCMDFKKNPRSVIFNQWEFGGDVYHLAQPGPDSPFNDSVYTFKPQLNDFFGGGGAPAIHSDRVPCEDHWCAHLRRANPVDLSREQKLEHFYGRSSFRFFTNEGLRGIELDERAKSTALDTLHVTSIASTAKPSTVKPPEVCEMKPSEYIEEVIKRAL